MSPSAIAPPTSVGTTRPIELRGVRVHNLQGIDLDIPLGKLVVLSGVSGSGKSSLAFDTIFAEGQRRYIESFSPSARQYLERIERPNADRIAHVPPTIAIRTDAGSRSANATVASIAELDVGWRRLFARLGRVVCPDCQIEVRSQSATDVVSMIHSMTPGTRFQIGFKPDDDEDLATVAGFLARGFSRVILNGKTQALQDITGETDLSGAMLVVDRLQAGKSADQRIVEAIEAAYREGSGRAIVLVECDDPGPSGLLQIDERTWSPRQFSQHWDCAACGREFLPPEPRMLAPNFAGGCPECRERSAPNHVDDCPVCHGTRLCPAALAVRVGSHNLADVLRMTVAQSLQVCHQIAVAASSYTASRLVIQDLERRLRPVVEIGLGYLTLMRPMGSLSGGQVRRLMLAGAIGSGVTGTLCLVDEPSAGVHASEIPCVIGALRKLLAQRNSVIVVDHDREIILAADHVIDLGPGAGPQGGRVVFTGLPDQLSGQVGSATAEALRAPMGTVRSRKRRHCDEWLALSDVEYRTLHGVSMKIPLGVLCVVTGPGGSGKTSLIMDVLVPALRHRLDPSSAGSAGRLGDLAGGESLVDVAVIDRTPLTRSARSNAATWIEAFDEIREVFALTADAKQRGFGPQHFSFNASQGGRCRACRGTGILKHDMQFLPDVTLTCPECHGTRFRREILDIKYRGRSIADVLAMSAAEAVTFFRNHARLQARLQMLKQIGLDYLVLGQPTETLSGGEAQRLKLASRLTSSRGPTLIVCDEATAGLHPADVARLVACFDELLGIGHSIVAIDNSPDLLAAADHIIDLGQN
jgi:excinuclease ABC subunit A